MSLFSMCGIFGFSFRSIFDHWLFCSSSIVEVVRKLQVASVEGTMRPQPFIKFYKVLVCSRMFCCGIVVSGRLELVVVLGYWEFRYRRDVVQFSGMCVAYIESNYHRSGWLGWFWV